MGYALAQAAVELGHEVTLISGPVCLTPPTGLTLKKVTTAQEMYEAVGATISQQEVAIFCAAVADYRPIEKAAHKLKKHSSELVLRLERTPDILGSARTVFAFTGLLVGFAAETENLPAHATEKMQRKGCDLLVANQVGRAGVGFDSEENEILLFEPHAPPSKPLRASKLTLAKHILRRVEELVAQKNHPPS
jgi:phosphopantothenoylcysteine synthetase/decarboxylase